MEIFEFVKRLHGECIRLTEHIAFDKKHARHLYLVALYGSLIELTGSLITLIEKKHRIGVPPVFRSLLEAYVELNNLHENSKYGHHMQASYDEQWLKVLREAKNKPNPYLADISKIANLDAEIKRYEQELTNLMNKGYRSLNVFERFERAGMEDEYRSLYNFLSSDAHSNIRALVGRHLEIDVDDFTVVYYKDEPLEGFLTYLDTTAATVMDASRKIHDFFQTGKINEVNELGVELDEIRSSY